MSKIYSLDTTLIRRNTSKIGKFFKVVAIILVICAIVASGFFIACLLTNNNIIWFRNYAIKIDSKSYYLLAFEGGEIKDCGLWLSSVGGASYCYDNIVFAQVYDSKMDADKVVDNLGETPYAPKIIEYKFPKQKLKIDGISNTDKRTITNNIKIIYDIIDSVRNVSNKIDKNEVSNINASSEINNLKSSIKIANKQMQLANINYNNETINKYSDILIRIEDILDDCVNKLLTSANYKGVCKYTACSLTMEYYDFLKNNV